MMGNRHARPTTPFKVQELAKLVDAAAEQPADAELSFDELDEPAPPPAAPRLYGRAQTLHDPLTTSLLAEVARHSQTVELDDDDIDAVIEVLEEPAPTTAKHAMRRR